MWRDGICQSARSSFDRHFWFTRSSGTSIARIAGFPGVHSSGSVRNQVPSSISGSLLYVLSEILEPECEERILSVFGGKAARHRSLRNPLYPSSRMYDI